MHDGGGDQPAAATYRTENAQLEHTVMLRADRRGPVRGFRMDDAASLGQVIQFLTRFTTLMLFCQTLPSSLLSLCYFSKLWFVQNCKVLSFVDESAQIDFQKLWLNISTCPRQPVN